MGEYYQVHNIREPISCSCGAEIQTREHILFECETHEEHWHIIDEGAPDCKLATILGTKKGIEALARFVRGTKAFQKQKAQDTPQKPPYAKHQNSQPTTSTPDMPYPKNATIAIRSNQGALVGSHTTLGGVP